MEGVACKFGRGSLTESTSSGVNAAHPRKLADEEEHKRDVQEKEQRGEGD